MGGFELLGDLEAGALEEFAELLGDFAGKLEDRGGGSCVCVCC